MKILRANRQEGKTTDLIKKSHDQWKYIVCSTHDRVQFISKFADQLGITIPHPISISEILQTGKLRSNNIKSVLVDDIEDILQYVIGKPVDIATTSCEIVGLHDMLNYAFSPPEIMRDIIDDDMCIKFTRSFPLHDITIDNNMFSIKLDTQELDIFNIYKSWLYKIGTLIASNPSLSMSEIPYNYIAYITIDKQIFKILPHSNTKSIFTFKVIGEM